MDRLCQKKNSLRRKFCEQEGDNQSKAGSVPESHEDSKPRGVLHGKVAVVFKRGLGTWSHMVLTWQNVRQNILPLPRRTHLCLGLIYIDDSVWNRETVVAQILSSVRRWLKHSGNATAVACSSSVPLKLA